MIRLDTTTRKLQALLAGAITTTQPDVVACWTDRGNIAAGQMEGGSKAIAMASTTAVDIVDAPDPATVRDVDFIQVRNNDTVSVVVTVRYVDGATLKPLVKVTLLTLQTLCYVNDGWQVLDSSGNLKL